MLRQAQIPIVIIDSLYCRESVDAINYQSFVNTKRFSDNFCNKDNISHLCFSENFYSLSKNLFARSIGQFIAKLPTKVSHCSPLLINDINNDSAYYITESNARKKIC